MQSAIDAPPPTSADTDRLRMQIACRAQIPSHVSTHRRAADDIVTMSCSSNPWLALARKEIQASDLYEFVLV
jgi:hypothetical protein